MVSAAFLLGSKGKRRKIALKWENAQRPGALQQPCGEPLQMGQYFHTNGIFLTETPK